MTDSDPLDPTMLQLAYANGYFPMPHPDSGEIHWFHPDPRAILPLDGFHCSRSLRRRIRQGGYEVKLDHDFRGVMAACAERDDTWIDEQMKDAYGKLFDLGVAHSLEIYAGGKLIGGVYGVVLGGAFFAESKFHRETDASKLAIYHLVCHLRAKGFHLLEVQFMTEHLKTLGAIEVTRAKYMRLLSEALNMDPEPEYLPLALPGTDDI